MDMLSFLAESFDLPILDWIAANLWNPVLDVLMPLITLLGDAGIFWIAIAVVLLVSIPVNAIVLELEGVSSVMQLPWSAALILILTSVALTFIAGLLPSQKAAHADPVEALRSE